MNEKNTFPTDPKAPKPVTKDVLLYDGIKRFSRICHSESKSRGWWQDIETGLDLTETLVHPDGAYERLIGSALVAQKIALIHSEISEALEGVRKNKMDDHLPHRLSIEVELADAMIRIGDLAEALGLDLAGATIEKLEYNAKRADHDMKNRAKDGGKKF